MIKNLVFLFAAACFFSACNKSKHATIEAQVIRNCSGTYLSIDTKNYQVCNEKILKKYNEGDQVKVAYHTIAECNSLGVACAMYFQNEGLIEVDEVTPH